ncbi:putative extracellular tungstate binding protein [Xylaria venustula]|nr:putative extracellular tungstate binding protein [Xylaria venustula]
MMHRTATICAVASLLAVSCSAQSPSAIYDGGFNGTNAAIELRIGNGGAGQSGLIGLLADEFMKDTVHNGNAPFKVALYMSDTTYSIEHLGTGLIDVGITYSPAAEQIAVDQGIATKPIYYAFRDHFLLVGPAANPANISGYDNIAKIFSDLRSAAESGIATDPTIKFLSRYDKSATNIKESMLWAEIGQVSSLGHCLLDLVYHQYIAFPIQALTAAILLEGYTITDKGTTLSLDTEVAKQTVIYKAGTDEDPNDPLLNPAHLLVGAKAPNPDRAVAFATWVVSERGQSLIASFKKNGDFCTPLPHPTRTACVSPSTSNLLLTPHFTNGIRDKGFRLSPAL